MDLSEMQTWAAELEQKLKALKKHMPKVKSIDISEFTTNICTGEALRSFVASVRGYRERECFRQLHSTAYHLHSIP